MRIAGIVLDLYDDPKGAVLRTKIASSGRQLPEKLASARILSEEELGRLPDRLFAFVATNGDDVVRKYAMHDEAHLVLSMIYFNETGHLLPGTAQQKVAANLINGCSWYEMDPPAAIVKTAMVGSALVAGLGAMDMAGKVREGSQRGKANMDAFRMAQASGVKQAGREIELSEDQVSALSKDKGPESGHIWDALSHFSDHDATWRKLDEQLRKIDQPEAQLGGYPPGRAKKADLVGTEAMPAGGSLRSGSGRRSPSSRLSLPAKTAAAKIAAVAVAEGWLHCGDVTEAEPVTTRKIAAASHYALPHLQQYPIDTAMQVKQASAYFDTHITEFPLAERRMFAQTVSYRANELGTKISGELLKYAGDAYGPHLVSELHARISQYEGTGKEAVYELLLEKRSEISPMVMADMLREADEDTGASRSYGRPGVGLLDPFAAVYGSVKIAANEPEEKDTYSWSEGTDYTSAADLLALAGRDMSLDDMFGKGFAHSFRADPVGIFKSMPSPQKVVLSRLAANVH